MKIYLAGPIRKKEINQKLANIMRSKGHDVYVPMELKIENAWDLPNSVWGKQVFEHDLQAINEAELVVVSSFDSSDHFGGSGTTWEHGYAYGINKKIVVVHFEEQGTSLMIANSCNTSVRNIDDFEKLDLNNLQDNYCDMEQT